MSHALTSWALVLSLLLAAWSNVVSAGNCKGCLQLDSYNFDKIISGFKAVLVKFDVAYPYGEKHDHYAKVSESAFTVPDLIVAEVGVKDYGEKENQELADRFNVAKDDFPVVKIFVRGHEQPFTFDSTEFNDNSLKRFIRQKSGVYIGLPGCLEAFDALAKSFLQTKADERKKILRQAEDEWDKLKIKTDQTSAQVYVKTMRKIIDKGDAFIAGEIVRVENLLKYKVAKEKKDEMQYRLNIYHSFVEPPKTDDANKEEL